TAATATQQKKGAPAPLPHSEEDCPNAPSAPIPGAMRQSVRIVPALDPISCASRAGQSHQYYTVHEALYGVKLLTCSRLDYSEHVCSPPAYTLTGPLPDASAASVSGSQKVMSMAR